MLVVYVGVGTVCDEVRCSARPAVFQCCIAVGGDTGVTLDQLHDVYQKLNGRLPLPQEKIL